MRIVKWNLLAIRKQHLPIQKREGRTNNKLYLIFSHVLVIVTDTERALGNGILVLGDKAKERTLRDTSIRMQVPPINRLILHYEGRIFSVKTKA